MSEKPEPYRCYTRDETIKALATISAQLDYLISMELEKQEVQDIKSEVRLQGL